MEAEKLAGVCEQLLSLNTAELSDAYYYTALPLCIIDAVFSIGVKYAGVENTVKRYCHRFGLKEFDRQRDAMDDTQTVSEFVDEIEQIGIERSADVIFQNHQRTSSRNGILKAEAVLRFAKVLKRYDVDSLSDLRNRKLTDEAERAIKDIPGQKSGLALQYFYMLSGDDNLAKPDRHVLKFLEQCTGEKRSAASAQKLLSDTVELLRPKYPALTVRLLDYTIWNYMAHGGQRESVLSYHKLVRDRIPEIIEASGKNCTTETLSDADYLEMLDKKLDEELAEYHTDQNLEELADLLEVIRACAVARGYSVEELEQVRAEKVANRGGFENKILLKEIIEI